MFDSASKSIHTNWALPIFPRFLAYSSSLWHVHRMLMHTSKNNAITIIQLKANIQASLIVYNLNSNFWYYLCTENHIKLANTPYFYKNISFKIRLHKSNRKEYYLCIMQYITQALWLHKLSNPELSPVFDGIRIRFGMYAEYSCTSKRSKSQSSLNKKTKFSSTYSV